MLYLEKNEMQIKSTNLLYRILQILSDLSMPRGKATLDEPISTSHETGPYFFGGNPFFQCDRSARLSGILQLADKGIYPLIRPCTQRGTLDAAVGGEQNGIDVTLNGLVRLLRGGTRIYGEDDEELSVCSWLASSKHSPLHSLEWSGCMLSM